MALLGMSLKITDDYSQAHAAMRMQYILDIVAYIRLEIQLATIQEKKF